MYFDQLYYLSKAFCATPCTRNSKNAFTPDKSNRYKIRLAIYITTFTFLSIYIRIYTTTKTFLQSNGHLSLNNYIYLANALLTTVLIILQVSAKKQNAARIAHLNNNLKTLLETLNNPIMLKIRKLQFIFLIIIIAFLLFINSELHAVKINMVANFVNEAFIEMISFVDAFEYFNNVYAVLLGFNCIARSGFDDVTWGLYLKLLGLCREINAVQAVGISSTVVFIFLWTMFDAYVFFGILLTGEYSGWKDFIRCAPWVVLHSWKLLILLAVPGICKYRGESVKALIFHDVRRRDVDKALNRYLVVMNEKIVFAAYNGWFQLDYMFAASMFGTIMTYLIILYQFTNVSI